MLVQLQQSVLPKLAASCHILAFRYEAIGFCELDDRVEYTSIKVASTAARVNIEPGKGLVGKHSGIEPISSVPFLSNWPNSCSPE